jgi:hypothetical protein
VFVTNRGNRTFDKYHVDLEFPTELIPHPENITITVIERMMASTGARPNRALTQVAHLQVSGHIDGSIVADSIKRQ